jgi:hypothetical protein
LPSGPDFAWLSLKACPRSGDFEGRVAGVARSKLQVRFWILPRSEQIVRLR